MGCCVHLFGSGSWLRPSNLRVNSALHHSLCYTRIKIVIQLSKTYMLLSNTFHIILLLDVIVNKFPPLWIRTTNFCVLSTVPLPVGVMEVFGASGEIRTLMPFSTAASRLRACHFHHRCKKIAAILRSVKLGSPLWHS